MLLLLLSQLNKYTARIKAIKPLKKRTSNPHPGANGVDISKARPRQAFMACVVGRSRDTRNNADGSISEGTIKPPRIMEGRKMDWLNKTMERELGETTPINIPRLARAKAEMIKIKTKYPQ